jgi:hypothetical protein
MAARGVIYLVRENTRGRSAQLLKCANRLPAQPAMWERNKRPNQIVIVRGFHRLPQLFVKLHEHRWSCQRLIKSYFSWSSRGDFKGHFTTPQDLRWKSYSFCPGGIAPPAGSGSPGGGGSAPLNAAGSMQSPAQSLVPLKVPTSLHPAGADALACAGAFAAALGGGVLRFRMRCEEERETCDSDQHLHNLSDRFEPDLGRPGTARANRKMTIESLRWRWSEQSDFTQVSNHGDRRQFHFDGSGKTIDVRAGQFRIRIILIEVKLR